MVDDIYYLADKEKVNCQEVIISFRQRIAGIIRGLSSNNNLRSKLAESIKMSRLLEGNIENIQSPDDATKAMSIIMATRSINNIIKASMPSITRKNIVDFVNKFNIIVNACNEILNVTLSKIISLEDYVKRLFENIKNYSYIDAPLSNATFSVLIDFKDKIHNKTLKFIIKELIIYMLNFNDIIKADEILKKASNLLSKKELIKIMKEISNQKEEIVFDDKNEALIKIIRILNSLRKVIDEKGMLTVDDIINQIDVSLSAATYILSCLFVEEANELYSILSSI
ncbi:MAG: hypothetical protein J7L07_10100 [Candidatus Odinarchaeota archaeon]|nr:hypothetical protein [Candidatus Odinarchaeota archaeon]